MNPSLDEVLQAELARLEAEHLRRTLRPAAASGPNFASNDYLGLANHPALVEAARRATAEHGTGAGASRLVTGTSAQVLALEESLAAWKEKEAALVFSSGYAAALGTIPALVGTGDTVIARQAGPREPDRRRAAERRDAARLSAQRAGTARPSAR